MSVLDRHHHTYIDARSCFRASRTHALFTLTSVRQTNPYCFSCSSPPGFSANCLQIRFSTWFRQTWDMFSTEVPFVTVCIIVVTFTADKFIGPPIARDLPYSRYQRAHAKYSNLQTKFPVSVPGSVSTGYRVAASVPTTYWAVPETKFPQLVNSVYLCIHTASKT